MAKRRYKRKRVFLLLVLLVLGALFVQSEWLGRYIYPIYFKDEIRRNALKYEMDPLLIAAIIRVESNYKPDAVSPKGAIGIMQIMPDTAEEILAEEDFASLTAQDAQTDVNAGIMLGTWYIRYLHDKFDHNLAVSLAAYNAGLGNVGRWLEKGVWDGKVANVRDIPYGETRHYVKKVMYYYKKYQSLYETL